MVDRVLFQEKIYNDSGLLVRQPVTAEGEKRVMICVFSLVGIGTINFGHYRIELDKDGYMFSLRTEIGSNLLNHQYLVKTWIEKQKLEYLCYLVHELGHDTSMTRTLGFLFLNTILSYPNRVTGVVNPNTWISDPHGDIVKLYHKFIEDYNQILPISLPKDEYLGNNLFFNNGQNQTILNMVAQNLIGQIKLTGNVLSFDVKVKINTVQLSTYKKMEINSQQQQQQDIIRVRGPNLSFAGDMFPIPGVVNNFQYLLQDGHLEITLDHILPEQFNNVCRQWHIDTPSYTSEYQIADTIAQIMNRTLFVAEHYGLLITE